MPEPRYLSYESYGMARSSGSPSSVLTLGTLTFIMQSMVLPVLPAIGRQFHTSVDGAAWALIFEEAGGIADRA
jgi:hypothetical protein